MAINEITDKIRKSINTIYTVYYISFLSDCMTIFSVLKPYTSLVCDGKIWFFSNYSGGVRL